VLVGRATALPATASELTVARVLAEGAVVTEAGKEAHVAAEPVLMKDPLKLAGGADRDVELRSAAGVVRGCRSCTTGRSQQLTRDHDRGCREAGERSRLRARKRASSFAMTLHISRSFSGRAAADATLPQIIKQ